MIKTEKYVIIHEAEALKILGFHLNCRNTMDTHLNATSSKISMILSKLKPALKHLTEKNRNKIISAKVKPVALYGIQLMLGQNQRIFHKAETVIMTTNPSGLSSSEALCN